MFVKPGLNSSSNSSFNLPLQLLNSSRLELQYFILGRACRLSIRYTIGRVKTPNMKHPLWNLDMVTRKCLAPNSSIYWIVANIPGSGTLTKPRLELTSAPNQQRENPSVPSPFHLLTQPRHWETECLFEVMLYSELLDGNTLRFSLLHAEFALEHNAEHDSLTRSLFMLQ